MRPLHGPLPLLQHLPIAAASNPSTAGCRHPSSSKRHSRLFLHAAGSSAHLVVVSTAPPSPHPSSSHPLLRSPSPASGLSRIYLCEAFSPREPCSVAAARQLHPVCPPPNAPPRLRRTLPPATPKSSLPRRDFKGHGPYPTYVLPPPAPSPTPSTPYQAGAVQDTTAPPVHVTAKVHTAPGARARWVATVLGLVVAPHPRYA